MTPASKLSPKRAAEETLALFRENTDEKRAASYQRFFKEPVDWFGVENKLVQQIQRDLLKRTRGSWSIRDAVNFCKAMVKDPHMEARGTGFQLVAGFVPEAPPELLADIKKWLERSCGNWGLVDNLAPSVLGPLIERYPELIPEVRTWTGSSNLWLRRGAVVAFVPLVKHKRFLKEAYGIATSLLSDDEDLMHKAVGWLLREAGKSDMKRLERYLLSKGPKIPRTTVRYAIEKFPKDDCKRLLMETKAKKKKA